MGRGEEIAPMELDPELDAFWGEVLSRDPARILLALGRLTEDQRAGVVSHLHRMASEEGWSEGQRESSLAALAALAGRHSR
jgi:hypothetical protein